MGWTPYEDSIQALKNSFTQTGATEYVGLMEAQERILAEDIIADENSPEAPTSAMDGYAIRAADQEKGELRLVHHLPAGTDATQVVEEGTCIKTFTGSLMSEGADALIPIENVTVDGDRVIINEKVKEGFAVRPVGESYRKDEVLIPKGVKIGFAEIGTLAGLGIVHIPVKKRPRVAILATGNEIVDIGQPLTNPAQIRSSNHVTLAAIVKAMGAEPLLLGIAGDDKELIKARILEGLHNADIVITTGGVSVGDYDFVKDIIKGMDVESIIEGAAIKPGRHIRVVKAGEKYIFALPGFPYSAAVVAYLYIVPLIENWLGVDSERRVVKATLEHDYKKRSPYTEFTACNLLSVDGEYRVNLDGKKMGSSAILNNMLNDTALLCVPLNATILQKGEKVDVLTL